MDTLHAPGARTPFGHGAGARVWQGRRAARGKEREAGREDEAKRRCDHTLSLNRASYLLLTNHQTQKILKKLLVS